MRVNLRTRTYRAGRWAALCAATLMSSAAVLSAATEITSEDFGGLSARSIGPAVMSGRIAAMDATHTDPLTIYVGAASGGLWRSKDAGVTFSPIFDDHIQSIGAVRIAPADSNVIWVGTGESWTRNSVSIGDGIYKSTDAGETWTHMGLGESERIARIRVHPTETDTVFVCATGQLWSANEERGVYKTTDGGTTWNRVLYIDEDTGCSDIDMDPQDPNVLYAGMWQFRREPDFFTSGGPGSGLYKSTDAGETWHELTEGLPSGEKGRIAVAVAPSRASRVYAVVEAEDTALFRSDDLGQSWEQVNNSFNVSARPFYFAYIVVDPEDFNRVYKPGLITTVSVDGGKSFTSPFTGGFGGGVHSDHHALWVNPTNPHEILLGTDGGLYLSNDRANSWRFSGALPLSQFYEVSYDMDYPYNVYGGLQDNGTWMGPTRAPGGVQNKHWTNIGFGDGFHAYVDAVDSNVVYVEYQGGQLLRYHRNTGEIKQIKPYAAEGEPQLRFNWNAPIHLSPTQPGVLYYGAQSLFRSTDRGDSWEKISDDLTTNDPKLQRQLQSGGLSIDNSTAENNATIYTISESPVDGKVLWVGTDDGNVAVSRDGGATWADVSAGIPGMPERSWISHVEASPHDAATAFMTSDHHRRGDMATYVYRTTDYGATWTSLGTEALEGFAHVVLQDPVNPQLLFLGTELGLFISFSGGEQWARFESGLPKVPVHDLDIHRREGDLIIGTHGRGIYILDDLTPMRSLTSEALDAELALLPSRPSVMVLEGGLQEFNGDDQFVGRNPSSAASIVYFQKKRHIFGDLKVEVYNEDGELITTLPGGKRRGMNRVDWPMRLPAPKLPPATALAQAFVGPRVPEGTYNFKLIKGKKEFEGEVQLVADPRSPHSAEDRAVQQEMALELYALLERLTYVVDSSLGLRDQAKELREPLSEKDRVGKKLDAIAEDFDQFRSGLVSTSEAGWLSGDEKLREQLADVYSGLSSYDGRPSDSQIQRAEVLGAQLEAAEAKFKTMVESSEMSSLNSQLSAKSLEPLTFQSFEDWKAGQEAGESSPTAMADWTPKLGAKLLPFVQQTLLGF